MGRMNGATLHGMSRKRVSATVDATRLAAACTLTSDRDSELFDKALAALIDKLEGARERAALARHPYDTDPALELPEVDADGGADLPYKGRVPPDVVRLARRRRRRHPR